MKSESRERIIKASILAIGLTCSGRPLASQRDAELAAASQVRSTQSLLETIALPPEKRDVLTKQVVIQLAASAVPRMEDASRVALGYVVSGPGLDARDGWKVTGLFRLAVPISALASPGDLVWKVRVHRMPGEIVRVLLVSTTTKSVREMFPEQMPTPK